MNPFTGTDGQSSRSLPAAAAVFASSLAFYVYTLAPTVIWGDSASFATSAVYLTGLYFDADAHPLFIILGHYFSQLPFEPAYSINLLTAITASLAVLMSFAVIYEITGSIPGGIVGATSLALSHAFWLHAVIPEVYDLNAFFVLATIWLLLRWRREPGRYRVLFLAAFVFGLGMSNHLVLGIGAVAITVFVLITDARIVTRPGALAGVVIAFCLGSSLVLSILLGDIYLNRFEPQRLTGVQHLQYLNATSPGVLTDLGKYGAYLFYQFPLVGFILGFTGVVTLVRRKWKIALLLLIFLGVNMTFFVLYGPGVVRTTKYTFYISDYAIFSVLVGCGFHALLQYLQERGYRKGIVFAAGLLGVVLLPLAFYLCVPSLSKKLGIDLLHARTIPYRDNEWFFLFPGKRGYTGAEQYGLEALEGAEPGSMILADYTPYAVLKYLQLVRGVRKDVEVLFKGPQLMRLLVETHYGTKVIYLADTEKIYYPLRLLEKDYDLLPEGVLFRVVRKDRSNEKPQGERIQGLEERAAGETKRWR